MKQKFWEMPLDVQSWCDSPNRIGMGFAERGLYLEMLMYQWKEGSIPADAAHIAIACGGQVDEVRSLLTAVLPNFKKVSGNRLVNTRLEEIREAKLLARAAQQAGGRKGGLKGTLKGSSKGSLKGTLRQPQAIVTRSIVGSKSSNSENPTRSVSGGVGLEGGDYPDWFSALVTEHADCGGSCRNQQLAVQLAISLPVDGEALLADHRAKWQPVYRGGRLAPDLENWLRDWTPDAVIVPPKNSNGLDWGDV